MIAPARITGVRISIRIERLTASTFAASCSFSASMLR
jgi:hypothetical protein